MGYIADNVSVEDHVIAVNEGAAVAIAAGNYLATGSIPCVYFQNSGLGNAVNPLVSLTDKHVCSIPMLLLVGWRGEPGRKDEPQHCSQGQITPGLLKDMGIAHSLLPDYDEGMSKVLHTAYSCIM